MEAVQESSNSESGLSFSFAKIWAADKDSLEEVQDDQTDSWAQALQKITLEREKEQVKEVALSGRGARRRAADIAKVSSLVLCCLYLESYRCFSRQKCKLTQECSITRQSL